MNSPWKMAAMKITLTLMFIVFAPMVHGTNYPTKFLGMMDLTVPGSPLVATSKVLHLKENTRVNTPVILIRAQDPERMPVRFRVDSNGFSIDFKGGVISLKRQLDYEKNREAIIVVKAFVIEDPTDTQTATATLTVAIQDVNDMPPQFAKPFYIAAVSENATVGTVVLKGITAVDREYGNIEILVTCDSTQEKKEFKGVCDTFGVRKTSPRSDSIWIGDIILKKKLSYAYLTVWQIPLKATDGVNSKTISAEIDVDDYQDQPPRFISQMSKQINEGLKKGDVITTVVAIDPDKGDPRKIHYELVTNPGGLFVINSTDGVLRVNVTELDRDRDSTLEDGFVDCVVRAREIIVDASGNSTLGNDRLSTSTATLKIMVADINDNKPTWNPSKVNTIIDESIADGGHVRGTNMEIVDYDQNKNSEFKVVLLDHTDIFKVHPESGSQITSVSVRIKNSTTIDYESNVKSYVLRIVAEETATAEKYKNTATVTIKVEDVNDNMPIFAKESYILEDLSETATGGTSVPIGNLATDKDSGKFGTAGLRYHLIGEGERFFEINPITGAITVKPCATPGSGNCLDREVEPVYDFSILVKDDLASERSNPKAALLRITLRDENDNSPIFRHETYTFYIREGQTSTFPSMKVEALDADSPRNGNNVIRYELVYDFGLWRIGTSSGVISATRPVDYEGTPNQKGKYVLTVKASDSATPYNENRINITINVIDINDHRPQFKLTGPIDMEILETTEPDTWLINLEATDGDLPTLPTGKLSYNIRSGGQDKFVINSTNGTVSTSGVAAFDYNVQNFFQLVVVAQDHGTPNQQRDILLKIKIKDVNNKNPYFRESPVRREVKENETVGYKIIQMLAGDVDTSAKLRYSIIKVEMTNPNGVNVSSQKPLFKIDPTTGWVSTAEKLNRDKVSEARITIEVKDLNGVSLQTATALLIVAILDVNDEPPEFAPPWTRLSPHYNVTIDEEQPLGSMVIILTATDSDGIISEYILTKDPDNLFGISSSGMVTSTARIDYEKINSTYFVVIAKDTGIPLLTATATVNVKIRNLNDESPKFTKNVYSLKIPEISGKRPKTGNFPDKKILADILATDDDLGDFGEVGYKLIDPSNRFFLRPKGKAVELFLNGSAVLDRETTPDVVLQLVAYDSPKQVEFRRNTTIPIYIRLTDLNDNDPRFLVTNYYATVLDTAEKNTEVIRVIATDPDLNQTLEYKVISENLFKVDPKSGQVLTADSLLGLPSPRKFRISVTDNAPEKHVAYSTVTIILLQASRKAPVFTFPPEDMSSLTVLEEQYRGLVIATIKATPATNGSISNARITYGLYNKNGKFSHSTDEFQINPITGVLNARVILDREKVDKYTLQLAVRDDSKPPLETRRYIYVVVGDVDDHQPSFPLGKDGKPKPYKFLVQENAPAGVRVGVVHAEDKDIGLLSSIYYHIVSGNDKNVFRINITTGIVYTAKALNREAKGIYILQIEASNMRAITRRQRRQAGTTGVKSVVSVQITVGDVNDNPPKFDKQDYRVCVPSNTLLGDVVAQTKATDPDFTAQIMYSVGEVTSQKQNGKSLGKIFTIDFGGTVTLAQLVSEYKEDKLTAVLTATDKLSLNKTKKLSSTSKLQAWVTVAENTAKLTVTKDPDWVRQHKINYIREIQMSTKSSLICVNEIRHHRNKYGEVDSTKTDILVSSVDSGGKLESGIKVAEKLREAINSGSQKMMYQWLGSSKVGTYKDEIDHDNITISMTFMVVLMMMIVLAIVIFVCVCCCLRRMYERDLDTLKPMDLDYIPPPNSEGEFVKSTYNPTADTR